MGRMEREKKRLLKMRKKDPFYLAGVQNLEDDVSVEEIPITELDLSHMDAPKESKKSKKSKKNKKEDNPYILADAKPKPVVKKFLDEPEGDDDPVKSSSKDDALDIDISAPLR